VRVVGNVNLDVTEVNTDLDSHADQCVVGRNALIVYDYDKPVNIVGYDPNGPVEPSLSTVSAALAYDCPTTGSTIILIVNQAIHNPKLDHNLLSTFQMRLNEVMVNDIPKCLTDSPTERTHAIIVTDPETNYELLIPLSIRGVTSTFPTRKPTQQEYNECIHFDLTYDSPEYEPTDTRYERMERQSTQTIDRLQATGDRDQTRHLHSVTRSLSMARVANDIESDSKLLDISHVFNDHSLAYEIKRSINVASVNIKERRNGIDAQMLARNFGIGLDTAKKTLKVTTQRGVRSVANPTLSRRFRTNDRQLRYKRLPVDMFTDTMISKVKSRRQNQYAQIYATAEGWTRAYPMQTKSQAHETLSMLHQQVGVPNVMIMDGSKEQTLGQFRHKCRQAGSHVKQTEPYSPWQNAAEGAIRELKKGSGREMVRSRAPKKLWDYCLERQSLVRSLTALEIYALGGEVPESKVMGDTADITAAALFRWYEWVYFRDTAVSFPEDNIVLGRDLGPAIDIGPALARRILKDNGQVVIRSTVRSLTEDEIMNEEEKAKRKAFDTKVHKVLGDSYKFEDLEDDPDLSDLITPMHEAYEDDDDGAYDPVPDIDDADPDTIDRYIGAEVELSIGDKRMSGKVRGRKRGPDGSVKGTAHSNPVLDTRTYEVEFPDGQVAEYSANIIAENMYSQCDSEGNQYLLLDEIVDWHRDDSVAITGDDMYVMSHNGNRHYRKTTKGWKLCVKWRDGSTSWVRLAELKESFPIEVAEFAVAQGIHDEPAFIWWVPYVLARRNRIVSTVARRYQKRTHKYGLEVPKDYDDCIRIDTANGNTLWQDAIRQEMAKVLVAFRILDDNEEIPTGYQRIDCHMVYDIKMEDFRRKARFVAGGHMTSTPATNTYASVVSRESVRTALTLAALNDLEVKTADIENAYLTAPVTEKVWTILGPEFGEDAGKRAIVVRSLYGLKSAGASFRNHMADCMRHLGWESCLADQDLWMKAEVRPQDGHKYYAYALLYVDDILVVHHDAMSCLKRIDKYFKMKPGSIGDPDFYLGAKLRQTQLPNGVFAWGMSSSKYIQAAVKNVMDHLAKMRPGQKLATRASGPFPANYAPEIDTSPELGDEDASFYQSQIGVLRWIVELGRIDIITEVSTLSSHVVMPRKGHLDALFHLFAYLGKKHNARIVFDPSYPDIDMTVFKECDWKHFYGDVKEAIPPNAPSPRGKEVDIRLFVDSDFANDQLTRRSRSGFLIYLNMAPIVWYSKKQATIETSVFGSEFVAMKQGTEALRGLRYKLRMMGVPLSGPSFVYGDNMSVIHNTQRPESTLKKKSNSVCYHAVREAVAMGECLTGHIPTESNPADLATKLIPGGMKRDHLVGLVLYDICDDRS